MSLSKIQGIFFTGPTNPSTFSLVIVHGPSSSHLAIQQELCQEKQFFQVGKFVSVGGGVKFFLVTVWRQSCDKSTVKLLTTVAFCDMSTVDISTVYIYTSPHHPLQVCANNNQYYEGEDDAGMMSEAETSSSRTRRGGLPGREVGKVLSESS